MASGTLITGRLTCPDNRTELQYVYSDGTDIGAGSVSSSLCHILHHYST